MCRRLRTIAICACWPPRHPDAASRNDRSAAPGGKPVDVQTDQDYCGDSAAQAVVQPARNTAPAGSLAVYISTFYSFKGGVGRTMALVNAAVELARRGRRVLAVDFDLEAPGCHVSSPRGAALARLGDGTASRNASQLWRFAAGSRFKSRCCNARAGHGAVVACPHCHGRVPRSMRFAWFRRSLGRSDECTENFQLWHGSLGHTGSVSQELFERVVELDEADRESRNDANYAMHGVDLLGGWQDGRCLRGYRRHHRSDSWRSESASPIHRFGS